MSALTQPPRWHTPALLCRGRQNVRGWDGGARFPYLPFLTAFVRRQELAPNRERGALKASRGCRGFVGPVPQPLLISRAYSVVPTDYTKQRSERSRVPEVRRPVWPALGLGPLGPLHAEHSPSMTTGANSADSARSTKSVRHGVSAVSRSRSASVRRTRSTLTRPKNAVADSPVVLLAPVHLDQPIDRLPESAAPESSRPGGRTSRRRARRRRRP